MESQLVADAMTLAVELSQHEQCAAADVPLTDACRQDGLESVVYDRPSGPDGDGFITVGELRDRRHERPGFVLVHPATKALRIAWSTEFGN